MQFFTCGFFFTKTYYKLGMLFLSGCRSKFSPWHHAVHVWHTAGLGGSGVSHIYRELEGMFKSNSHHSGKHLR